MRFTVCIKQVPDVTAPTRLENGRIVQDSDRMVLNAYDASAVEECLVLREKHGGEIHLVLVGPERGSETVRKALAMGADTATHVVTDADRVLDSRSVATILAAYLKGIESDVIACGKQSQDTDAGLTGGMLAVMLGLPFATNAVGLALESGKLVVTRQADTGRELIELDPPCLVTCSNDMNNPRIPSLKGIMASKKKAIERVELGSLGIDDALGRAADLAAPVAREESPPPRTRARLIDGDPETAVRELVSVLTNEARAL